MQNNVTDALRASTHRVAWTIAVGAVIYYCHCLKAGNTLRWFLEHSFWQPFAKMGLSLYLIHDVYIILTINNMKELSFFDVSWMLHIIAGDFLICSLLAVVLYIVIEAPVNELQKYLPK
jgi:peptidoglycan/LPS O-acetylase OafA/YrhL